MATEPDLQAALANLVIETGTQFKTDRAAIGNLAELNTSAKTSLVLAINEALAAAANAGGGSGVEIDDSTPSSSKVYSSTKTQAVATAAANSAATGLIDDVTASSTRVYSSQQVTDMLAAQRAEITGGASAALDTFGELVAKMGDDEQGIADLVTAVGNRVRFDAAQTLTGSQKAQALSNIGAVSTDDIGDPTVDLVALFQAALL